jgi:hypothetical protein
MKSGIALIAAISPVLAIFTAAATLSTLLAQILANNTDIADGLIGAMASAAAGAVSGAIGNSLKSSKLTENLKYGVLSGIVSFLLGGLLTAGAELSFWSGTSLASFVGIVLGIKGKVAYEALAQLGYRRIKDEIKSKSKKDE